MLNNNRLQMLIDWKEFVRHEMSTRGSIEQCVIFTPQAQFIVLQHSCAILSTFF